jgi:hypothetical protein
MTEDLILLILVELLNIIVRARNGNSGISEIDVSIGSVECD